MIAYASRTGTRRNLAALRVHGWRLLVSATGVHRHEGFRYAIDNGAWTAFQQKQPWDRHRFEMLVDKLGKDADWIAAPDIVEGGGASLRFSEQWVSRLLAFAPVLIPVQDGMTENDLAPLVSAEVGIFVGGSTDWKLASLKTWRALARRTGCHLHVARVNSQCRLRQAYEYGADSFDGSGVSRFSAAVEVMERERRKGHLRLW